MGGPGQGLERPGWAAWLVLHAFDARGARVLPDTPHTSVPRLHPVSTRTPALYVMPQGNVPFPAERFAGPPPLWFQPSFPTPANPTLLLSEGDVPIPAELFDEDGELDTDHMFCSKCRGNESDEVGGRRAGRLPLLQR